MTDRIYPSEYYGDDLRWFLGVVEDNNDPLRLGRVRVRVFGIHTSSQDEIQTSDLPWAQVVLPTTSAGVSGIGQSPALQPGAHVYGIFLDGRGSQLPLVMGSMPRIESPTSTQQAVRNSARLNIASASTSTPPGMGVTGERNVTRPETDASLGAQGNTNPEIAFNFFVSSGFTPQQSAGIVGNLMKESGPSLNTSAEAAGTEQSYGIAQWNRAAQRFQMLQEFSSDLGRRWTELEVQLKFIVYELENYSYLGLSDLRRSTTIRDAVIAFQNKFERPNPAYADTPGRIRFANDIYSRMIS